MEDNDEFVWDVYQESPPMSTYLLAFVVSNFTFRQSNNTDTKTGSKYNYGLLMVKTLCTVIINNLT
jgi:hypothetical protein